jgi:hypothetical protein
VRLAIQWHPRALYVFYELEIVDATAVDRAVLRLAETGQGRLEWVPPYHRLRTPRHEIALSIRRAERTVCVMRIYRAR